MTCQLIGSIILTNTILTKIIDQPTIDQLPKNWPSCRSCWLLPDGNSTTLLGFACRTVKFNHVAPLHAEGMLLTKICWGRKMHNWRRRIGHLLFWLGLRQRRSSTGGKANVRWLQLPLCKLTQSKKSFHGVSFTEAMVPNTQKSTLKCQTVFLLSELQQIITTINFKGLTGGECKKIY